MINMEEEAYEFSKMFNECYFALKTKKNVCYEIPYFLPVLSFQLTLSWRPAVAASQREAQLFCNLLFSAFVVATTSISIEKPRKSFELLPLLFRSSRTVSQRSHTDRLDWYFNNWSCSRDFHSQGIHSHLVPCHLARNALARVQQVQRVQEPADLWDITFCTRWFWGF